MALHRLIEKIRVLRRASESKVGENPILDAKLVSLALRP